MKTTATLRLALCVLPLLPLMSQASPQLANSPCPDNLPALTRCFAGQDEAGAFAWVAMPPKWNGVLVMHAHGGPELGEPKAERALEDLKRWSVWPRAGFAYAGSGFRQGGVAVRSAAEDTERLRKLFIAEFAAEFGPPRRTVLHGQSWGAGVAARAGEMFATQDAAGKPPYDALLLTSGVLGGGTRSYDFRLDLRVIYQALCANHPRADEPQYPLWQGLPLESKLSRNELATRVNDCTGIRLKPEQRSAEQQQKLDALLKTVRIPERSLLGHLNWATWHFQDIVFKRLGGRNPFGNIGARYVGSNDDEALNARVARYAADPAAVAAFAADTDPQGRIPVPVLSLHAVDDPTAFVELQSQFRDTMAQGGSAERLVQVFTADAEHSYLSDAQYLAAMAALLDWVERADKPTPASVAERCEAHDTDGRGCRFLPSYKVAPLESRIAPRRR